MKSLKTVVSVLYTLSENFALGDTIGLVRQRRHRVDVPNLILYSQPFPPAKAIFAGLAILLAV